jgi:hypothetical protein
MADNIWEMTTESKPNASGQEPDLPKTPPANLRQPYLRLSHGYQFWCAGMLLWSILCVAYFIQTDQRFEMAIGISLCVVMLAMIGLPTVLFGGQTWYKRLAWITTLQAMFCVMLFGCMAVVVLGVGKRIQQHRYSSWPFWPGDIVHLCLSVLTVVLFAWTIVLTVRAVRMVRQLARGEYELGAGDK